MENGILIKKLFDRIFSVMKLWSKSSDFMKRVDSRIYPTKVFYCLKLHIFLILYLTLTVNE